MTHKKRLHRDMSVSELQDKLRNLRVKQNRCISAAGIGRLSRLIHEVERDIVDKQKVEAVQ